MATLGKLTSEKPSDNDYVIIWYLQTLIRNGGQCNMYNQGGINAPDANDRIHVQNYLSGQGYIRNLPNDSRTTYQIVEPKGRQFFHKKVFEKVMDALVKSNDFMQVSSILASLKVDDESNHFSKAITSQIRKNYNIAEIEEDDSIMLMDDAKEKYAASKYNFEDDTQKPSVHNVQNIEKNYGVAMQYSQVKDLAFQPIHIPPTTPTNPETKHGRMNAAIKFILNNIILVIILTVIAGLLVAYYTHLFGWNK